MFWLTILFKKFSCFNIILSNVFILYYWIDGDITGQPLECPFSPSDEFKLDDFTINEPNIVLEKDSHYPISACSAL